jgi:hypothetical protein
VTSRALGVLADAHKGCSLLLVELYDSRRLLLLLLCTYMDWARSVTRVTEQVSTMRQCHK